MLESNTIFNVLNPKFVSRNPLQLETSQDLKEQNKNNLKLTIKPFAVPGKVALWLEDETKGKDLDQ